MIEENKYPIRYGKPHKSDPDQIYKPEYRFDTRGRLVMPLTPYQRKILHTTPGSKIIAQGGESEAGGPQDDPASIKTGYLHATTTIKVGPSGGWVLYLSGGTASRPIQFANETSGVVNFYLDSDGNVYMKGEVTASSGIIGGWNIQSGYMYAGSGANTVGMSPSDYPFWAGATYINRGSAPFRVGVDGSIVTTNIVITGIQPDSDIAFQSWQTDLTFSSMTSTVTQWNSGTITILDGTTYNITASNTGTMSALNYIYLNPSLSITHLQKSTVASDAIGSGRILIATAQNNTDVAKESIFQVYGGSGGMNPSIGVGNIVANSITANEIVANTLTVGTNVNIGTAKQNFTSTPTTPYYVGDLWSGGSASDLKVCTTQRLTGAYNAADWALASKYTEGATWGTNLINIPGTLGTPAGTGLFLSSTHLGYYDSPTWKTYMDSSGNFYLGGTSGKLQWTAATDTLLISGTISASTINIGTNAWHVDINGNMWWGASASYAAATYKISTGGVANLSGIVAASVAAENITGSVITGKTLKTFGTGVGRVEINSGGGYSNQIAWFNSSDTVQGIISINTSTTPDSLSIATGAAAPDMMFVATDYYFYGAGIVNVAGDVAVSGTVTTAYLRGDTGAASFAVADITSASGLGMAIPIDMNNNNINEVNNLGFNAVSSSPGADGQMAYYATGGTYEMRVKVNGTVYSLDLTAV